jgi:hypothetical protein
MYAPRSSIFSSYQVKVDELSVAFEVETVSGAVRNLTGFSMAGRARSWN